ncbi:MAG: 50S ribosomal protein L11 methyltransferase [Gammaproteobacteria bacterium]|jgi:ribosomal protein L11 methyltransferase
MPWIQLRFLTDKVLASQLSDALSDAGAASVMLQDAADQPLLEPGVGETPLWDQVAVTGLFDATANTNNVIEQLRQQLAPRELPAYQLSPLEDRVWEREWMKHFHPLRFGRRTWICPSWQPPPDPDATNIFLDPGLAFGTGTHPTTALCLEWLDRQMGGGETVIDYGCGSGILAIGALKLAAREVWAVDNDPQALVATRENARKNGIGDTLRILSTTEALTIDADVLLANILANPLITLAPLFAERVKHGGIAVLSGILLEQQADVLNAYQRHFELLSSAQNEHWVRLELKRK